MRFLPALPTPEGLPEPEKGEHEVLALYSAYRSEKNKGREATRKNRKKLLLQMLGYYTVIFSLMFVVSSFLGVRSANLSVIVIYIVLMPLLLARLIRYLGPTAIQSGKQGIRLHWAHFFKTYSSPWIPWQNIDYASSDTYQSLSMKFYGMDSSTSLDITVDVSNSEKAVKDFVGRLWLFGLHHKKPTSHSRTIRIDLGSFINQDDIPAFVSSIKHFLPEESFDKSISEKMTEGGDRSYTEIWLEQFDGTRASQLLEPLPPDSVVGGGKYKIIQILAAGGHAVTYKGEIMGTDQLAKTIALKEIVLPVAGGAQIRKRALENVKREAELLQKLDHEQIVHCLDVFSEGHKAYICLDYIDGFSLRRLITESGPMEETGVLKLAGQMADILGYLHSQSPPLLHRDFTPDNLILKPDGNLVLIDFNVAEQREGFETSTVVGKHSYIPPEQFRGKATIQSDIYALGCTLHWLLTAEDPEPITASHPKNTKPDVSEATDDLVAHATAPDAQARFKTVGELLAHESLADLEIESPSA